MTQRAGQLQAAVTGGASFAASRGAVDVSANFSGAGGFTIVSQIPARGVVSFLELELTQSAATNTLQVSFAGSGNLSARANLKEADSQLRWCWQSFCTR